LLPCRYPLHSAGITQANEPAEEIHSLVCLAALNESVVALIFVQSGKQHLWNDGSVFIIGFRFHSIYRALLRDGNNTAGDEFAPYCRGLSSVKFPRFHALCREGRVPVLWVRPSAGCVGFTYVPWLAL